MRDRGFSGSGNRFVTRFSAGEPVYADQLNDLASGLGVTLPQPYVGNGASVSFLAGGSVITSNDDGLTLSAVASLILGSEYVNHYEVKTTFDPTGAIVLKVAKGGNIWRPVGSACDQESRADVIETDGTLTVVTGANPASPWASDDGYIALTTGGSLTYYVYAFKVEQDTGAASFHIYVSTDGTLADSCPTPLPTGITPPSGAYTVQGLKIATVSWVTALMGFAVDQHLVGSITWPNAGGGSVAVPEQFTIEIDQTASTFRMRKGNVISVVGGTMNDPYNGTFDSTFSTVQFQILDYGVWKDGSRVVGTDYASPYVAQGGHINLVNFASGGSDGYRVCIILNRNKIVGDNPGSNLSVCVPYLAFFAIGGDGDLKTQPFLLNYIESVGFRSDAQPYYDCFVIDKEIIYVYPADGGDPSLQDLYLWGKQDGAITRPPAFKNFNAQKVVIADILWNSETSTWDVKYGSKGPITIPNNMTYAGASYQKTYIDFYPPAWWGPDKENATEQLAWENDYTDCTKFTTGPLPTIPL